VVWILVYWTGADTWWSAGIAFAVGFSFRLIAMLYGREKPLPKEPKGIVVHKDNVLFGRNLSGKSQRELADLALAVDGGEGPPAAAPVRTGAGGRS
jgi:hypothetical protein